MGGSAPTTDRTGSTDSGQEEWTDNRIHPLANHPAILAHGSGVNSSDLSDFIMSIARMSASRVQGIGNEQYGGEIQKFETMSSEEIFQGLLEEVADIFAYASFLAIKAGALR
jgi:hypothetical protein